MDRSEIAFVYEFSGYRLDAAHRKLLSPAGTPISLSSRVFDTLIYLIEHRGELVDKAALMQAVWPGAVVEENNLNQAITSLRKALGEKRGEHRFIATDPGRGYRFVADVDVVNSAAGQAGLAAAPATTRPKDRQPGSHQSVRFCTTPDGVRLAYAIDGKGPPLVRGGHWLTHAEYDWDNPIFHHLLRDLSRHNRLLRYDHRGDGLSDWDAPNISLEGFVIDLETVVDAAGLDCFALLGMSMSCAVSVAYAVKHPERLTHLVLYGGFARAREWHDDEEFEAMATLIAKQWGNDNPGIRNIFTSGMMPDATREEQDWFDEMQRISVSAENAARITRAVQEIDVTALLSEVRVPTLVIHCREEPLPLEAGRSMAAAIPNSRFVVLEGRNHILLEHDPASARFKEVLFSFLDEDYA